jgi:hypothetical protein
VRAALVAATRDPDPRVRAAGVLLDKAQDPVTWAKDHLANDLTKPVYTL